MERAHKLTYLLTHSPTHSLTPLHSFTHSFIHSLTRSFVAAASQLQSETASATGSCCRTTRASACLHAARRAASPPWMMAQPDGQVRATQHHMRLRLRISLRSMQNTAVPLSHGPPFFFTPCPPLRQGVPAIRSLIGTALDGRLMATASSDNTTLASINGGLTWHVVDASAVPPVTTAAVEFADP